MTVLKSLSNIQKSGNMTLLFPQRVTLQDRNNLRAHQSHEVQCMLTTIMLIVKTRENNKSYYKRVSVPHQFSGNEQSYLVRSE